MKLVTVVVSLDVRIPDDVHAQHVCVALDHIGFSTYHISHGTTTHTPIPSAQLLGYSTDAILEHDPADLTPPNLATNNTADHSSSPSA